jgi:hypothetical protein
VRHKWPRRSRSTENRDEFASSHWLALQVEDNVLPHPL